MQNYKDFRQDTITEIRNSLYIGTWEHVYFRHYLKTINIRILTYEAKKSRNSVIDAIQFL